MGGEGSGRKKWTQAERQEFRQKRAAKKMLAKHISDNLIEDPTNIEIYNQTPVVDQDVMRSIFKWMEVGMTKPQNNQEWAERVLRFFKETTEANEYIPWEKFCFAMGYTVSGMDDIMAGRTHIDPFVSSLLEKSKSFCQIYDAEMVSRGKLPQIAYIFRAKNYFGMKSDQQLAKEDEKPDRNLVQSINDIRAITDKYVDSVE